MRKICLILSTLVILVGFSASQITIAATPSPSTRYVSFLAQQTGGFTTYEWAFQRTPSVIVYSDGLTISEVPYRTAVYPGAITSTFLQKTEPSAVNRVLAGATKVKLTDPKFDWGAPLITDLTDTNVITQQSPRAARISISIYALGFDNDLDSATKSARKAASSFIEKVENFSSDIYWTKSKPVIWKPTRWVYMANRADKDEFSVVRPWFGSKPLNENRVCQEMSTLENSRFNAMLPKLNQASRFTSGGQTWRLSVRPLFPHESGCARSF